MTTRTTKIEPLEAHPLQELTDEEAAAVAGGRQLRGEVVTNNLGPVNRQKKHVARLSMLD
jgi:hypothetical protein